MVIEGTMDEAVVEEEEMVMAEGMVEEKAEDAGVDVGEVEAAVMVEGEAGTTETATYRLKTTNLWQHHRIIL